MPTFAAVVLRMSGRRQEIALGDYLLLLQASQRKIGTITAAKYGQWFRSMQTYYLSQCIDMEDIETQ